MLAANLDIDHHSELSYGGYFIRLLEIFHRLVVEFTFQCEAMALEIAADIGRYGVVSLDPNVVCRGLIWNRWL